MNPFEDAKQVGKITHLPESINAVIKENCLFIKSKISEVCKIRDGCTVRLPKTYKLPGVETDQTTNLVYGVIIKLLEDKGYKVVLDISKDPYAILHISWPMDKLTEMHQELKKIVDNHLTKQ